MASTANFLWFLFLLITHTNAETELVSLPPDIFCDPLTEYFDSAGFKCTVCNDGSLNYLNKIPDTSSLDVYGNAMQCTCPVGLKKLPETCVVSDLQSGECYDFKCDDTCSEAVSLDKASCVTCNTGIAFNSVTDNDCTCATGYKLVEEFDATTGLPTEKTCKKCPAGTAIILDSYATAGLYVTAGKDFVPSAYTCATCPDANMEFIVATAGAAPQCVCKAGYTITGQESVGHQFCYKHSPSKSGSSNKVEFNAVQENYFLEPVLGENSLSVDSTTFDHYYSNAASKCEFLSGMNSEGLKACQTLANLCVMQMYDKDSTACSEFDQVVVSNRDSDYHDQQGWKLGAPWLYYSDSPETILADKNIKMQMSFTKLIGFTNIMTYKLAKFSLNGTFVGMEDLGTQFSYCGTASPNTEIGGGSTSSTKFLKFGTSQREEYTCDLQLLAREEMFFYDMYVVDEGSDSSADCDGFREGGLCLYPVPVLHRNFVDGSDFPNLNNYMVDEGDDEYTRRFFLFDNMSGRGNNGLEVIRYAKRIVLRTSITTQDTSKIHPPILTIEYYERKPSAYADRGTNKEEVDLIGDKVMLAEDVLVFKTEYTMNTDEFWSNTDILIGFVSAVAGMLWMVRIRNWQNRTNKIGGSGGEEQVGMMYMLHVVMLFAHTFVVVFFPFVFCMCAYWFVFFKLQDTVFVLMPANNEYYDDDNEYFFYIAMFHALFWTHTVYLLYVIYQQCNTDIFLVDWEKSKTPKQDVSIWRTIMVANEWNEMQTSRKTSIEFSLFFIGFFLYGLGLENNATMQPNIDDVSAGYINPALRFCNTTWYFFVMFAVQWVWQFAFYERYYKEPRGQVFIDLCTIAKISVFIMDEPYHGFYLHCRSPYEFADGSMMQLTEQLKKEESGLTTDRGLDAPGAPRDCQAFELFTSPTFRGKFDKVYSSLHQQNSAALAQQSGRLGHMVGRAGGKGRTPPPERMVEALKELNGFLQSFVEQSPPPRSEELKRIVREPPLLDMLMGNPPADIRTSNSKCIFYPDKKTWLTENRFLKVVFLGIEPDLWMHNVLTFNVFDVTVGNTAVSILMTYLMHLGLVWLRGAFGQANVANKTLVDDRFLV